MLLSRAGVDFTVVPSSGDEESVTTPQPQLLALDRAQVKARGAQLPPDADGLVLGADTVVALGMRVYGKPADDAEAFAILSALQGTTHTVLTGHHAIRVVAGQVGAEASGLAIAKVTMRPLTPEQIHAYLATGEHRGRAGAYAIQETGDRFVSELQGSWGTVVGLSVSTVAKLYRELTDAGLPISGPTTRMFTRTR
jgi:septum formation protein